jgi:hypothetical protein
LAPSFGRPRPGPIPSALRGVPARTWPRRSSSDEKERLETFAMLALPPGWFALQKADSKTLTVLLSDGSKCALDLCTDGPTADGPCAEKRAR